MKTKGHKRKSKDIWDRVSDFLSNIERGMFWHVHHDKLAEYCYSFKERADYIRGEKPKKEIGIRLRLFKPVRGKLPVKFNKVLEAYEKAAEAYEKVWEARGKVWEARGKVWALESYEKAWEACEEALKAREKVWAEEACKDKVEALHKKECPNCPWDGKRIRFE